MAVTGLSGGSAATNGGLGGGAYSGASNTGTFTPSSGAGLVQKAYDRLIEFELRSTPLLRSVADKKPARQAMPGSSIALQIYADMAKATSVLSEEVDPAAVALGTPTIVNITLNEYGNATLVSKKLGLLSLADVDPAVANIIAFNMADSIDDLAQTALLTGTNVLYGAPSAGGTRKTSTATITSSDTFRAQDVRRAVAKLRGNKTAARKGSLYWCGLHPEVSHDLRAETGAASWRNPHEYQSNGEIWAGEIGQFEGAYFIESPRLYTAVDGADATALATASAVSGVSGEFTIVAANAAFGGLAKVGDKISGTGVGTAAKITAISVGATNTTFTVSVANSATVGTNTLTVTPVTKVFRTFIAGQQALAEAVAEEPHVVIGPVTDRLMRQRPIGWYGVLGHAIYRNEALFRIETGSSIA
jgi:N4-gp56 family major capsid protein